MTTLLYLHGFLSSPHSVKAQQTGSWLQRHQPNAEFVCPFLSSYPEQAFQQLTHMLDAHLSSENKPIYLVGSSMGGFWATVLAERYDLPAVVVNPACYPDELLPKYLNQPLRNYHTDDTYVLDETHLPLLRELGQHPIQRKENIWALLQTGDETLDYREAERKYQGCRLTLEVGGDHSFQGYDRHLPDIWAFLSERWAARTTN